MSKSLSANFSGPFQVGAFENYLSKFSIEYREKKERCVRFRIKSIRTSPDEMSDLLIYFQLKIEMETVETVELDR